MDSHLVTVEVSVEGLTRQRVQLDSFSLDEDWLERLNTQAVQRRRTVEHDGVLCDGFFEHIPHFGPLALHHPLRRANVLGIGLLHQALHDEWLEQLQRHKLRQTALVQFQLWADNNHRTAGVVDTLTQQVLTEAPLLTFQQVRERLQRTVAGARDGASATAVVEEGVDGFLKHALLVVHDDLGRAEVDHALQAVVAVDDATVQVVEVRRREPATVELNHRAELGRNHRDGVQDHRCRIVTGTQECGNNAQTLERTDLLLSLTVADNLAEFLRFCFEVKVLDQRLDGFCTHAAGEVVLVAVNKLGVDGFVDDHLLGSKLDERVPDLVEAVDFTLGTLTDVAHLALGGVLHLALGIGFRTVGLELFEVFFQLLLALREFFVAVSLDLFLLHEHVGFEGFLVHVTGLLVHRGDDVRREVDDLFQIFRREVQQVPQA